MKRGGRGGPAYHQAKPFAKELGRQMADLTEAGGSGQDAVMFLGSQGALLGAVQVRMHGRVPPLAPFTFTPGSIPLIYVHQEESLLSLPQGGALRLVCTVQSPSSMQ